MSESTSAYQAFVQLLVSQGQHFSPAELHGLLVGHSCGGAGFAPAAWLDNAAQLFDGDIPASLQPALTGLQEMLKTELAADDCMAITLLLPGDDDSLIERTAALGQWCQGFLSGFGGSVGQRKLSDEAREILEDYVAVAQIVDADDADDDESSFMEVSEYLRMTAVFLFTECNPPAAPAPAGTPAVH
ncbi:MAG: UPF0149 family protein [Gammaproteobacteria bacterium]|nr:UPF0149 family protein [Gammaproteobacteria bacterium]